MPFIIRSLTPLNILHDNDRFIEIDPKRRTINNNLPTPVSALPPKLLFPPETKKKPDVTRPFSSQPCPNRLPMQTESFTRLVIRPSFLSVKLEFNYPDTHL